MSIKNNVSVLSGQVDEVQTCIEAIKLSLKNKGVDAENIKLSDVARLIDSIEVGGAGDGDSPLFKAGDKVILNWNQGNGPYLDENGENYIGMNMWMQTYNTDEEGNHIPDLYTNLEEQEDENGQKNAVAEFNIEHNANSVDFEIMKPFSQYIHYFMWIEKEGNTITIRPPGKLTFN